MCRILDGKLPREDRACLEVMCHCASNQNIAEIEEMKNKTKGLSAISVCRRARALPG